MEAKQYLSHVDNTISKEMYDYVTNVALKGSRYLFVKKIKGIQSVYCTHCNKYFDSVVDLRVNEYSTCKHCGSGGLVKSSGRGRSKLIDRARVIYYEKSVLDPAVMVAKVFEVNRDYRESYINVKTEFYWYSMYIFKAGDSVALERDYSISGSRIDSCRVVYKKTGGPFSAFGNYNIKIYCSFESLEKAIKGTPFQYSTWERYTNDFHYNGLLKFFLLYSRYPCIEYLNKMGMSDIANAKIYGYNTCSSINWNGKNIWQVLKINKNQFNQLREGIENITPELLRMYQLSLKEKTPLTIDEIKHYSSMFYGYLSYLSFMLKYTTFRKAIKYIEKQYDTRGRGNKKLYSSIRDILTDYKDYIKDCIELEYDLKKESVILPKSLYKAHQNTIKQIDIKGNKDINDKILKRLDSLKKYIYEDENFIIRPAESSFELIEEGKALSHCVGRYADSYSEGKTNIFLIRKKSDISKPFYTLEFKGKEIIQIRGIRNCPPNDEVKAFVNNFKDEKLNRSKSKIRKIA